MSQSSSSSSEGDSRAASREDLKASTSTKEDTTTLPEKWINNETATSGCQRDHVSSDVSPGGPQKNNQHHCPKPSSTGARHRYKTHTQLIKEKLDHVKAEMQRIAAAHLDQRPERKAYHPFVWNSLSPYRDTTEIDHLLTMSADPGRRNQHSSVKNSRKYSNIKDFSE